MFVHASKYKYIDKTPIYNKPTHDFFGNKLFFDEKILVCSVSQKVISFIDR